MSRRFIHAMVLVFSVIVLFWQGDTIHGNMTTITWDGGGLTNNWSEAANWTGDVIPTSNDVVILDGTNTKDATIDTAIDVRAININTGYTGTITVANGVTATFNGQVGTASSQTSGTFTNGNGTVSFNLFFTLNGGTFNGGSGTINFNRNYTQVGGTFNGGGSNVNTAAFAPMFLNGGTFNAPSGTLTVVSDFNLNGAAFDHNNGTVVFTGTNSNLSISPSEWLLNNLTINKNDGSIVGIQEAGRTVRVTGTLTLAEGKINANSNSVVKTEGAVNIDATFGDQTGTGAGGNGTLLIQDGAAGRTITIPPGASLPHITINDPGATITSNLPGLIRTGKINLQRGTVNIGQTDIAVGFGGSGFNAFDQSGGSFSMGGGSFSSTDGPFLLSQPDNGNPSTFSMTSGNLSTPEFRDVQVTGGTFTAPSGTTTIGVPGSFNTTFTQSGGVFDANLHHGTVDINARFNLTGGEFRATSGNTFFGFSFEHIGGTFTHGNGTAILDTPVSTQLRTSGTTFNNLTVDVNGSLTNDGGSDALVNGTLRIANGSVSGFNNTGGIQARGDVIIESGADGGSAAITFGGTANQTFTNNGGVNTTGAWTIDKPSGTVTAASSIILGSGQPLKITNGVLYLNNNSNLTCGALTLGDAAVPAKAGRLVNDSATTITLGGNVQVLNNSAVDLQGGGAACPEADTIQIRSSVNGTQRNWTGSGLFRLVDVDVKDMAGTAALTVFSGTNTGNNGANWTFNASCPPGLSISPSVVNRFVNQAQTFTAGGGFAPPNFSLFVNNSGATINSSTGLYTAGTTIDVSDTIRVTDAFGATADATVNVTAGPPTRVAFIVQPTTRQAGQIFSPALQVAIQDNAGNTVTSATDSVTVAIGNNPGGSTLSGTLTRSAVNGIALFSDLHLNRSGQGYTLVATSGSLTVGTSNAFNVVSGPASQLVFTVQPTSTVANVIIAPSIQVAFQDGFGNTVLNETSGVLLQIGNNPSGGGLAGTFGRFPAPLTGTCVFDDLSINAAGNGYTLTASSNSPNLFATSATFDVISPFAVFNTNDSGQGSLRQTIINANNTPGTQTISFNISGVGPFTIAPTTPLPTITQPVVIDGTTQPGFAGSPIIELSGAAMTGSPRRGLYITAGSSTVKGLVINRFDQPGGGAAIRLETGGGNTIQGNYIGTNVAGNLARGNYHGIETSSSNNLIGGSAPGTRNVISGNADFGISAAGGNIGDLTNLIIQGNYIGTNGTGKASVPNRVGVFCAKKNVTIGGPDPGEGNVISGNTEQGIQIQESGSVIQGNYIGTDINGTAAIPNGKKGILVIGVLFGGNTIGGVQPGEGNVIAFNVESGVARMQDLSGALEEVLIRGNSIHSNGQLGIDLNPTGVNANDACDTDTGANGRQNFPVLSSVTSFGGNTIIQGTFNSAPNQTFTLDFYSNVVGDTNGFGEGRTYLGSTTVMTDTSCNSGTFTANLPVQLTTEQIVTATATDANDNTSEFSAVKGLLPSISGTVRDSGNLPIPNASVFLRNNPPSVATIRSAITDSNGRFTFDNLNPNLNYQVNLTKNNYNFTPSSRSYPNLAGTVDDNYTGNIATYSVAVHVRVEDGSLNGATLSGVTVTLGGAGNAVSTTDSNGNSSFNNLLAGTYSVSVSKQNFSFNPSSTTIPVSGNFDVLFLGTSLQTNLQGRIVFKDGNQLKAMNANGSGLVTLRTDGTTQPLTPIISPNLSLDGSKIVFTKTTDSFRTMNFDGSAETALPNFSGTVGNPFDIIWSHDKTKIAYSRYATNPNTKIFTMNADGSNLTELAPGGFGNRDASWSPNGAQIVFARNTGSGFRLFKINSDGTNLTQLSNNIIRKPALSPDGSRIAMVKRVATNNYSIVVTDANGNNEMTVVPSPQPFYNYLAWSPDGTRIIFSKGNGSVPDPVTSVLANGTGGEIVFGNGSSASWGNNNSIPTPAGSNVNIQSGGVSITLPSNGTTGETTITPISPASAGTTPGGFVVGNIAYDIVTTANFTPPAVVCFNVSARAYPTQQIFNTLFIFHNEGGVLVNRTVSRDFNTRRVCGVVPSFSPFVIAQQIDQSMPSITGLVIDQNGQPLNDFPILVSGDSEIETSTDTDGFFSFVNLIQDGNYTVTPSQFGYLFDFPNRSYIGITGENTFVFTVTQADFDISGTVSNGGGQPVAGVTINLNGSAEAEATTDANGNYSFNELPANGFYTVTPKLGAYSFTPGQNSITALQQDLDGIDFVLISPTAAQISVSGRVTDVNGRGLARARVIFSDREGNTFTAVSSSFGYYRAEGLIAGESYVATVSRKGHEFEPLVISPVENVEGFDFQAIAPYSRRN